MGRVDERGRWGGGKGVSGEGELWWWWRWWLVMISGGEV